MMTSHASQRQSPTLGPTPVVPHKLPPNGGALQPPLSASHFLPVNVPLDVLSQICEHYASETAAAYTAFGTAAAYTAFGFVPGEAPGVAGDVEEMEPNDDHW